MKKILSVNTIVLIIVFILFGCNKNEINYGETETVTSDQALLKFNYVSAYALNPSVQILINGSRVSPLLASRTPYPGGGYNTLGSSFPDYLSVTPGTLQVVVSIPKRGTNEDSVSLYKSTITIEAGKRYTAHITDTAANMQTVLTTDNFTMPDSGFARFTFVHLIPNVPAIDLYYGTTKVANNITYKSVSDTFSLRTPSTALAWTVREAGSAPTSTALATYTSASTTTSRRVYTAFALGYKGLTDAVRRPYISFLLNR